MANVCAIFEGEQLIPPVEAKAVIVGTQSVILCTDIIDVFSEPPFEDRSEVMIIRDLDIDVTPEQLTPNVSTTALPRATTGIAHYCILYNTQEWEMLISCHFMKDQCDGLPVYTIPIILYSDDLSGNWLLFLCCLLIMY